VRSRRQTKNAVRSQERFATLSATEPPGAPARFNGKLPAGDTAAGRGVSRRRLRGVNKKRPFRYDMSRPSEGFSAPRKIAYQGLVELPGHLK
jgi:hypothetical protein